METTALPPGSAAAPALDQSATPPAPQPVMEGNATSGDYRKMSLDDIERARQEYLANPDRGKLLEETPPPAPEPEAAAPVEEVPESDDQDGDFGMEPEPPPAAKGQKPIRVRPRNETEIEALRLHKAGMALDEAVAYVTAKKGAKPAEVAPESSVPIIGTPAPTPEPATDLVAALEAERADLTNALKEAMNDVDFEKATEIQLKLADLPFKITEAKEAAKAAAIAQTSVFEQAEAAAINKAIELYPESAVEGSEMWREMESIAAALQQENDPAAKEPDFGLVVARMAARNLGIAPSIARHPKSGEKSPAPSAPSPVRPRPVSGSGAAPQVAPVVNTASMTIDDLAAARRAYLMSIGQDDY